MRKAFLASLIAVLVAVVAASGGSASSFGNLNPGGPADLRETVPVNVVFVGLEPSQVDPEAFLAGLPAKADPVVRSRLWYGVTEQLGLHYTFDYDVTYASPAYENALFGALAGLATPAPRTQFQDLYNAETKNVLNVGQNHFIDAPTVEKWLIDNPPAGVDTTENTVFLINWYGRPDFKFHVYTKFGEPDPDTGFDFGVERHSRKIVAWGGTTPDDEQTGLGARGVNRVWFYDVSAGPEAWMGNYVVDNKDVDGDGHADERVAVFWEYGGKKAFKPLSELTNDLSELTRYGAMNLLFAPSPLYPPYITPERQPASINLDSHTYEGWPGVDASEQYQTPSLLVREVSELHRVPYTYDAAEETLEDQALRCYLGLLRSHKCYPAHANYHYFANLFLYAAKTRNVWEDGQGGEYEAALQNYASSASAPFLGYADDNWIDGTQSGIFNFVNPSAAAAGYGLTTTQIHEYGHHFGMSHPHDGYDSETGVDYGPTGRFFFAWAPDESNSMMSYIDLNWDFSQFDRDNANRFQAAAYVINANAIAADILASPNAAAATADLEAADEEIGLAKSALAEHDYVDAFDHAKTAYGHVRSGAIKAGVTVTASENGWTVLAPRKDWKGPVARKHYSYEDRIGPGTKRSLP